MSEAKPRFRLLKQGYDRFAVDKAMEDLEQALFDVTTKLEVYQKQANNHQEQLQSIKERYNNLVSELTMREKAADEIARLALKEANKMIEHANDHADLIVKEALHTAKTLLAQIARIAHEASDVKSELKDKLSELATLLEALEFPKAKAFDYLNQEEN